MHHHSGEHLHPGGHHHSGVHRHSDVHHPPGRATAHGATAWLCSASAVRSTSAASTAPAPAATAAPSPNVTRQPNTHGNRDDYDQQLLHGSTVYAKRVGLEFIL